MGQPWTEPDLIAISGKRSIDFIESKFRSLACVVGFFFNKCRYVIVVFIVAFAKKHPHSFDAKSSEYFEVKKCEGMEGLLHKTRFKIC